MADKDTKVVAVGLVIILIIAGGLIYGHREYVKKSTRQLNMLDTLVRQKDMEIRKLFKKLAVKEKELDGVKTELADANKKLEAVKTTVNQVSQVGQQ